MDSDTIFPEDILLTILTRLPAKTLHRFKCVSKKWLSLITSPHFIKAYLTLSPPSWILTHRHPRAFSPDPDPDSFISISSSLTKPPNISFLTIKGFDRDYFHPEGPHTILASSNGLVLLSTPNEHYFWLVNPVTHHHAVLSGPSDINDITEVTGICMAAKFTPPYEDVSLVVIVLLPPKNPVKDAPVFLIYKSEVDVWEARRCPNLWKADTCLEAGGDLFWVKFSYGLLVIENPFGKNLEPRLIPLPKGHGLPLDTPDLEKSRIIYPAKGMVHYFPWEGGARKVWRLTDVKKGEWTVLFKAKDGIPSGLPYSVRELSLAAFHPLEDEMVVMMNHDKSLLLNWKEKKVLDIGTCPPPPAENRYMRPYYSLVLPPWPIPLPRCLETTTFKGEGNFHFKKKNFKEALVYYSRSIHCFPTAAAYSNRAAAHLQLGKYQEAESDCSEALRLDNQYLKVYVRRATARKELGKLLEAKEDVKMALKLDGGQHGDVLKLSSEINCLLEKGI